MMNHWLQTRPSKPVLFFLAAAVLLAAGFGFVLAEDWRQYQIHVSEILNSIHSDDPMDLNNSFFAVAVFRACLFLIPAAVCLMAALAMHMSDNQIPKAGRKKIRMEKKEKKHL